MRVLHLYANYKWTGPADPAIRSAARLRSLGMDVLFAEPQCYPRVNEHRVREELWRWRLPVVADLQLPKHARLRELLADVRALRKRIASDRIDVIHCHQPTDHLTCARAVRKLVPRPVVVRTFYDPEPPPRGLRLRHAMRWTDGVVVPTRAAATAMVERHGMEPARVLFQEPVVEPRTTDGPNLRAAWGLDASHFVIGITARVQPHRRFELLWDVARRVVDRMPAARIVLLGRGNDEDMRTLVHEPVERLGLRGHVVLPGYQKGADYDAALRTLDAFVFLVPGSDGTCRAAREAMAQGLPVVTTTRGILPELVRAGPDGVAPGTVHDDDAAAMAADLVRIGTDAALRKAMGNAALARTRTDMDPLHAARDLQAFYLRLAALPRR